MCYKPITIYNPASRIPSIGGALKLKIPCGKCFECKEAKRSQYFVRTFAEYQRLEDKVKARQAVVYFDTLTYNNENLPHWQDIPVFNHKHIQDFLKRLRYYFVAAGFPSKDAVKYFICSEFGERKHRPHYHILLFLDFWIDPKTLWRLVRRAWTYGRTDRLNRKVYGPGPDDYFRGAADRYVDRNGALKYVSGYVVKDDSFMDQFNAKVKELVDAGHKLDDSELRSLQPRFFLSRGFGLSFIDDLTLKYHFDYDYYRKNGKIVIKDQKHIQRDFALPEYYRRKLFFKLEEEKLAGDLLDEDGNPLLYKRGAKKGQPKPNVKYYWSPNEDYIKYQFEYFGDHIKNLARNLYDIFNNLDSGCVHSSGVALRSWITQRLHHRTFEQLATYSAIYRNKLVLSDTLYPDSDSYLQNFYNSKFITLDHIRTDKYLDKLSMRSQEEKLAYHIISDRSSPAFDGFDEILDTLEAHSRSNSENKARFKINLRKHRAKYRQIKSY